MVTNYKQNESLLLTPASPTGRVTIGYKKSLPAGRQATVSNQAAIFSFTLVTVSN